MPGAWLASEPGPELLAVAVVAARDVAAAVVAVRVVAAAVVAVAVVAAELVVSEAVAAEAVADAGFVAAAPEVAVEPADAGIDQALEVGWAAEMPALPPAV